MTPASLPLQVTGLRKSFRSRSGENIEAVAGLDFSVAPGECFGLLGPNGAGKSTTLRCITGYLDPSAGQVSMGGIDVQLNPREARRWLGVCSQEDTLDTDFKVLDQLVIYASYFGLPRVAAQERAEALLKRFRLADKARTETEALSGGMRRRLQVARSLINSPRLVILDEPTTGLDPEVRRELWQIIGELRDQGVAVVLSTHYLDEAERLCDRVALMNQGKILACAPPAELVSQYMGSELVTEQLRPGVSWQRPPNLEDVYLRLTGRPLEAL
ncbi:MAG: ABC transporter ATP-binding protein [Candidatus Sericytochromatia bacterium]